MSISDELYMLKDMAIDAAQLAAAKAKQLAAIGKAKVCIASEEDKVKKAQIEIGKLFYRDFAAGAEQDSAEYLPWCEKITASKDIIEEQKALIEALKAEGNISEEEAAEFTIEVVDPEEPEEKTTEE